MSTSATNKILLTGGAGYIGSHTAIELKAQGFDIVLLDDLSRSEQRMITGVEKIIGEKIPFYQGNCADVRVLDTIFRTEKINGVIHFAAYKSVNESVNDPLLYYQNNLGTMLALLDRMQKHQVHEIVFSSSCTVYGQPDSIPVNESAPFKKATSPYGATKQICEGILEDAIAATPNLRAISLRYFNPIGAHPSAEIGELPIGIPNNLVPYITQTAAQIHDQFTVFGNDYNTPDGSCIRDFIDVVDLGKAHVQAMKMIRRMPSRLEAFNVGTGKGTTVLEMVKKFKEVTGVKLNYKIGQRRPGDIEKIYADTTKAEKMLAWRAQQKLEDSLLHAWNWEKKIRAIN